jgi:hypothetical protein
MQPVRRDEFNREIDLTLKGVVDTRDGHWREFMADRDGEWARLAVRGFFCGLGIGIVGGVFLALLCRHLDNNKLNNRANNLKWGTPLGNLIDAMWAKGKLI